MVAVVIIFLIILVIAWACYTFLPHPIGLVGGIIVVLLALLYLANHLATVCSGSAC